MDNISIVNSIFYLLGNIYNSKLSFKHLGFVSMFLGRLSCLELAALGNFNSVSSNFTYRKNLSNFSFLCAVDNINVSSQSFLVYLGFFKAHNFIISKSNIILPVTTYIEKISSFLNLEGRLRIGKKSVIPFRTVFSEIFIIDALHFLKRRFFLHNFSKISSFYFILGFFSKFIDYKCFFNFSLNFLSNRLNFLSGFNLKLSLKFDLNSFIPFFFKTSYFLFNDISFLNTCFDRVINNYYSTDMFSKNSKILSLQAMDSFGLNFSRFLKI